MSHTALILFGSLSGDLFSVAVEHPSDVALWQLKLGMLWKLQIKAPRMLQPSSNPKQDSQKKRIRTTLRTYTRANPRQSTQLSSVTGCHFSQKAHFWCCSLEIPPFAPAERQFCNILWPTCPGQVRAGVTGPSAHQGSASAL